MRTTYENYQSWGYTYSKKNGYKPLINTDDDGEENERKRRLTTVLRMKEKAEKAQYEMEHQFGYCPKCHCLLRLNGKCDNCD